jgi:hypothetical protein
MNRPAAPLLRRLRYTPLQDVLRFRLTGRLDWHGSIAASSLPQEVQDLIVRVVRRTRLGRTEKGAVASELIAHFHDGLACGEPPAALVARFGDASTAASLIRRAKIRNRSMARHALSALRWSAAGLVVAYAVSAVVFMMGRPSPKVDYVALINRQATEGAEADRAWPVYRTALGSAYRATDADGSINRQRMAAYRDRRTSAESIDPIDARPGDAKWPAAKQLAQRRAPTAALLRHAAAKPILGFRLGHRGDAFDADFYPNIAPAPQTSTVHELLRSVYLPYLNDLRHAANLLALDAAVAADAGDADRLAADIHALLGVARHVHQGGTLIDHLVSIGIAETALRELEATLVHAPALLRDAQLRGFAHEIGRARTADDLISFAGERMMFHDIVQHLYTDNGAGDGRITPQGLKLLASLAVIGIPDPAKLGHDSETSFAYAVAPAALPFIASRKEIGDEYDRLMSLSEANLARPLRDADWRTVEEAIESMRGSAVQFVRLLPTSVLFPALARANWVAERSLARREAIATAIALELYRRRNNGAYPRELGDLVPDLLPTAPLDRIDGSPLRYRLIDGRPLLYSVGVDRDDDGGRSFVDARSGETRPNEAAQWESVRVFEKHNTPVDADWVLYPIEPSRRR